MKSKEHLHRTRNFEDSWKTEVKGIKERNRKPKHLQKRTKEKRGRRPRVFEAQTWQLLGREISVGAAEATSAPPCPQAVLLSRKNAGPVKTRTAALGSWTHDKALGKRRKNWYPLSSGYKHVYLSSSHPPSPKGRLHGQANREAPIWRRMQQHEAPVFDVAHHQA